MCVLAAFDHDVRAMRTDAMPEITVQDAIRKTGELPIINIRSTGELPALTNYPAASEYSRRTHP
jgi:hypothetical protein